MTDISNNNFVNAMLNTNDFYDLKVTIDDNVIKTKYGKDKDGLYRHFEAPIPKKFGIRGLGKLHVAETLTERINNGQYNFIITPTECILYILFIINNKVTQYELKLPEVFDTDVDMEHIPEEFKQILANFRNKINNLEAKHKLLEDEIETLKDKLEIEYNSHFPY